MAHDRITNMSGKSVLIVDDHKNSAEVFKANLETLNKGLEIMTCISVEDAMSILNQKDFDLIISDIILPGKTGFDLLKFVKKQSPKAKVFIVSGAGGKDIKSKIAKAGADAFFYKPVDTAELLDAVERSLGFIGTLLPPELRAETIEPETDKTSGMRSKLITLKENINAEAVFLLGKVGQILMTEGDLPDKEFENTFIPRLFTLIELKEKIPEELNSIIPGNLHSFRISNYDVLSINFATSYMLLIVLPKDQFANFSSIYQSTNEIHSNLRNLGVTTVLDASFLDDKEVAPQTQKVEPQDNLLAEALDKEVKFDDAESFWDDANTDLNTIPDHATESLTFEQAKKLGLDLSQD